MNHDKTTEQLQPEEHLAQPEQGEQFLPKEKQTPDSGRLSASHIQELFHDRRQHAEQVKHWVSLKFYYQITEKIKQEESALRKLLNYEQAKQTILVEYSFVLDPLYFEQKFLST